MIREFTLTVVMKGRPFWGGLFFTAHDLLFNRGSRAALSGSKESARILSLFEEKPWRKPIFLIKYTFTHL
jgi:hypothetical protein